ncbi:head morphogenesis [Pseudomonas phage PspYZU05]|uniref:Head assembly chaperone protein n=1 Tax=Pseudomonas phage PspYZU05 TaxID=1983556 RepID=A0A2U7N579_9CAUD|nr:head morphogenesis [Pseudomonas phage PspYZU05]ASD52166.1 head assembly chaperone protein [Pseudomonas phage PspYZU05]
MKALGAHVILVSTPSKRGDEIKSASGIFLGVEQDSQVPEVCTVYSIGSDVPAGFLKVGDQVPLPLGNIRNVPQLDVALGKKQLKELSERYVTCHYSAIPCVY